MDRPPSTSTPAFLRALGADDMPAAVHIDGVEYRLIHVFKHDFFAATGAYHGCGRKIVLKIGRRAPVLLVPLGWIGRWLAWHESEAYRRVAGVAGIPAFLGRVGPTGIAHEYIEGRPLKKGDPVPDGFFALLTEAVRGIHQRRMAYVDLEKPENVIVGDDGRPWLIDFQIAWFWPWGFGSGSFFVRWITQRFQNGDRYHVLKLRRRFRPDEFTPEERIEADYVPPVIRFHRRFIRPLTQVRRWVLGKIDPRRAPGERGRVDESRV